MSNDFFSKEEPKVEAPQAPEKIKLGEKEYSQDELSQLVGLGEMARDIETRQNTKIDKVFPAFTRVSQEKKALEEKLRELEEERAKPEPVGEELNPTAIAQAREAAKKIGIVTDDQFEARLAKNFRQYYLQERAAEKLLETCEDYEEEVDGKDGRPAFKKDEVLNHMSQTGIRDPFKAYKDLYEPQLDSWKEKKLGEIKKPGFVTNEESGGLAKPKEKRIDDKNLRAAIEESLYGEGIRD